MEKVASMYKILVENSRRDLKALTQVGNLKNFLSFLYSFFSVVDPHWFKCGSGSSYFSLSVQIRIRIQ
jgi:hypothetical protein